MKTARVLAKCPIRSMLRGYMADYTNSTSAPRDIKKGACAVHIVDTGKIWWADEVSFASTLFRFKNRSGWAQCVHDAWDRGAEVHLWFLTQPTRFDGNELRDILQDMGMLEGRKPRVLDGPGTMYCIQHRVSGDYFISADRTGTASSTLLNNFLTRLELMAAGSRNTTLNEFVTAYAGDVINRMNFEIVKIATFDDNEDLWLKRQVYIDDRKYGKNLNHHSVD